MSVVEVNCGTSPVILAFPHTGTDVPPDIAARLNAEGQVLRDTDWHIHRRAQALRELLRTLLRRIEASAHSLGKPA
jgi:N-formylglutamate amidohydrolase